MEIFLQNTCCPETYLNKDSDDIEPAIKGLLDITTLAERIKKLSTTAIDAKNEKFNRHICGMLNLIMQHVGVIEEEKLQLLTAYPLSGATKEILELAPSSPLHSSEDDNTIPGSPLAGDVGDSEQVDRPLAIERVVEVVAMVGTESDEDSDDGDNATTEPAKCSGSARLKTRLWSITQRG